MKNLFNITLKIMVSVEFFKIKILLRKYFDYIYNKKNV